MSQLDLPSNEPTTVEDLRARTSRVLALRREMRQMRVAVIAEPPPPPPLRPPLPPPAPIVIEEIKPTVEEIPNFLAFRHNGSAITRNSNEPIISIRAVLIETANYFGMGVHAILAKQNRTRSIVNARHVAVYLSKKLTPYSYVQIGRKVGDIDHTSVLHALRRIRAKIDSQDEAIARAVIEIEKRVLAS